MEIEDQNEQARAHLELRAQLMIADADLEYTLGITDENRRNCYDIMLKDWMKPGFIYSMTRGRIQLMYEHVTESLQLLDKFKESNTPISEEDYLWCLDESYRERWEELQEKLREALES